MSNDIPFTTYQPPGVYTQTKIESESLGLAGGAKFPVFIGNASPLQLVEDFPVRRGPSTDVPIFVERENLSSQVVLGNVSVLKVQFAPIVNPDSAEVSTNPDDVTVWIDDEIIVPIRLVGDNGSGEAEIHLPFAPDSGSKIYASYFYTLADKEVNNEILSDQVDGTNTVFYTKNRPIVDHSNTGSVTNDTQYLTVLVNGQSKTVVSLDGAQGKFTLASAPVLGSVIAVSYKYSDFANQNDMLPNKYIHSIVRVGNVQGRTDYQNGVDYLLSSETQSQDLTSREIAWGNSFAISSLQESTDSYTNDWSIGGDVDNNLFVRVTDFQIFSERASYDPADMVGGVVKKFKVSNVIVDGSGKGKYLYDPSISSTVPNTPAEFHNKIFAVYVGRTPMEALPNGNTASGNEVSVIRLDGSTGEFMLDTAIDPTADNVYVIYYTNFMENDKYTFSKTADATLTENAKYIITSDSRGSIPTVSIDATNPANTWTSTAIESGMWNPDYPDLIARPTHAFNEDITVSFGLYYLYQFNDVVSVTSLGGDDYQFTFSSVRDYSSLVGYKCVTEGFGTDPGNPANTNDFSIEASITAANDAAKTLTVNVPGLSGWSQAAGLVDAFFNVTGSTVNAYKYIVTSSEPAGTGSDISQHPSISQLKSNEGLLGEPYIDPTTGLYMNIKQPADGASWSLDTASSLIFHVTTQGIFEENTGSNTYSNMQLPGLEVRVPSLEDLPVNSSIKVSSISAIGADEPDLGSTYYVSYYYYRLDFDTKVYTRFSDVEADWGRASLNNPLSLAAKMAFANTAPAVALKPLRRYNDETISDYIKSSEYGSNLSESSERALYVEALEELKSPVVNQNHPYVMVPLTDDQVVWSAMKSHVEEMSNPFFKAERYMITGFNTNVKDSTVRDVALNFKSNRSMIMYPVSGVTDIENDNGEYEPRIVPGWYYACAMAGKICRYSRLASDPLTFETLENFSAVGAPKTHVELNELGNIGLTIVEKAGALVRIRHAQNSDNRTVLTREPTVTFISDDLQKLSRVLLDRYLKSPFIQNILGEIESTFSSFMNSMKVGGMITDYRNVKVERGSDPTTVLVSVEYAPVLPINWIKVTFRVRGRLQ